MGTEDNVVRFVIGVFVSLGIITIHRPTTH